MSYQILGVTVDIVILYVTIIQICVTVDIVILYVTIQWKAILYVISDTGCDSRHSRHSLYVTIQWKAILYVISDTGCDSRHSHSICNNTMESNTLCHIRYWV